jgi:hypothetical protein
MSTTNTAVRTALPASLEASISLYQQCAACQASIVEERDEAKNKGRTLQPPVETLIVVLVLVLVLVEDLERSSSGQEEGVQDAGVSGFSTGEFRAFLLVIREGYSILLFFSSGATDCNFGGGYVQQHNFFLHHQR